MAATREEGGSEDLKRGKFLRWRFIWGAHVGDEVILGKVGTIDNF